MSKLRKTGRNPLYNRICCWIKNSKNTRIGIPDSSSTELQSIYGLIQKDVDVNSNPKEKKKRQSLLKNRFIFHAYPTFKNKSSYIEVEAQFII